MAFKYVPYTFRDGEIIEPTRVLENMRVLATEFNGKLDRDNLPEDAITESMLEANALHEIQNIRSFPNDVSGSNGELDWDKVVVGSTTLQATEDSVLICSFGARLKWTSVTATATFDYIDSANVADGSENIQVSQERTAQAYFELVANGTVISKSDNHTFLRIYDSLYLSGAFPVLAGTVNIEVRMRVVTDTQNDLGISVSLDRRILNTKLKKR